MKKRALITGIGGQDGYYLTKYLLELDYEVYGIIRRHANHGSETTFLTPFINDIKLLHGDLTDVSSIESAMHLAKPHEVYNLAAQSHVKVSFDMPQFTTQVNALGTLNMLEATRKIVPYAHFYQASTSEMFGNQINDDGFQRETTLMMPVSPYGATKLFGHNLISQYRNSYGMFACSGILFNHESPMRGDNFVTQKIVKAAVRIANGKQSKLELGNLTASRDWSHADDMIRGMYLILNHEHPDDFVLASGETYTVQEFVDYVFFSLNLDWKDYVVTNETHIRPEDVQLLRGDSSKARSVLGWVPRYTLKTLIDEMVKAAQNCP